MSDLKLYPSVNPIDFEPHYSRHVAAMTAEGLHAKSDIAAQLAWRDQRNEEMLAPGEIHLVLGSDSDFTWALTQLRAHKAVRRRDWRRCLMRSDERETILQGWPNQPGTGHVSEWQPLARDLLATDWVLA